MLHYATLLLLSPTAGMLSGTWVLQVLSSIINCTIHVGGLISRRVPPEENSAGAVANASIIVTHGGLLLVGYWVLVEKLGLPNAGSERICYWIFFAFSVLYSLGQARMKIMNSWRCAFVPGYVEEERLKKSALAIQSTPKKSDIHEIRRAAENGDAEAQYKLGNAYLAGEEIENNPAEAARWYRRAADQGFASAQCDLGVLYSIGNGVQKNDAEAKSWFQKAAKQGNQTAAFNLSLYSQKK